MMNGRKFWIDRLAALALCALLTGCAGGGPSPGTPSEPPLETQPEAAEPMETPPEAEEPVLAEDALTPFLGTWQDPDAPQCQMSVSREENGCRIDIIFTSGADRAIWQLAGSYDEIWEGVAYLGTRWDEHTLENGEVERTLVREEATGLLYFDGGETLLWLDDFDHTGENLAFVRGTPSAA